MYEFFYDNSLAIVLGASLGTILLGLALSKRKRDLFLSHPRQSTFDQVVAKEATERSRPDPYRDMAAGFEKRPITKRRELAASYTPPRRKPTVVFTPRQIERINIVRKQQGRVPFNRVGLKSAVSAAANRPGQPSTSNDWLTYLILYDIFFVDHQAPHCAGAGGITIDPNLPNNGGGGEFAGAGASGDWTSAPSTTASIAAGIAVGASAAYIASQLEDSNLKPVPVENYTRDWTSVPDPIADGDLPSGSAMAKFLNDAPAVRSEPMPEPAPQSRPDPVSVPDSAPSYTSSPDTSSGGGGDSGGGGGGGGGD